MFLLRFWVDKIDFSFLGYNTLCDVRKSKIYQSTISKISLFFIHLIHTNTNKKRTRIPLYIKSQCNYSLHYQLSVQLVFTITNSDGMITLEINLFWDKWKKLKINLQQDGESILLYYNSFTHLIKSLRPPSLHPPYSTIPIGGVAPFFENQEYIKA